MWIIVRTQSTKTMETLLITKLEQIKEGKLKIWFKVNHFHKAIVLRNCLHLNSSEMLMTRVRKDSKCRTDECILGQAGLIRVGSVCVPRRFVHSQLPALNEPKVWLRDVVRQNQRLLLPIVPHL